MGKHNDAKTPNVTEGRHLGIGGSDCYTLCHGKPDDVDRLWFEKLKLVDPVDLSDNFRVRLGTYTEEFNRKIFFEKMAKKEKCTPEGYQRGIYPIATSRTVNTKYGPVPLFAHLDDYDHEDDVLIEYKHTSENKLVRDVVETYQPQVQHYMHVTNSDTAYLSVIFGNARHSIKKIPRDPMFIEGLKNLQGKFWKCVVDKTRPSTLIGK